MKFRRPTLNFSPYHLLSFSFPLGKPLLVMALIACIGGAAILLDRAPKGTDLTIWLFANSHRRTLCEGNPSLVEQYKQATGKTVGVDSILIQALDVRLLSMFLSRSSGMELPDAVEIEINSIGKYFRPPVRDVGFYPLNDLIAKLPKQEQLLQSCLSPWTKRGVIFGIPYDIGPVAIIYRKDLFEEAGVDLASAKTWEQFQGLCVNAQSYWAAHGHPQWRALELKRAAPDQLVMMLMQRGVNLLDDQNRVHIADPKVAAMLAFYAQLIAGPRAIGGEPPAADVMWTHTLASGQICAAFCPDWRIAELKSYAPELAGKIRLMPLPRFESTDAPTATWGGTMIAIPRAAKNPLESWKMIRFLYLSPQALIARRRYTNILPPIPAAWNNPAYHQPDPFFGGQHVEELYIDLARQLPRRYVTPFSLMAEEQLASVMSKAIAEARDHGSASLEAKCQQWLNAAAIELQRRVDFGKFSD